MSEESIPDQLSTWERLQNWARDPVRSIHTLAKLSIYCGALAIVVGAYGAYETSADVQAAEDKQIEQLGIQDPHQRVAAYREATEGLNTAEEGKNLALLMALSGVALIGMGSGGLVMERMMRREQNLQAQHIDK